MAADEVESPWGFFQEWDGRGYEDAIAWTLGFSVDKTVILKEVRRLGFDIRSVDDIKVVHGHVGSVDGDDIPDVCDSFGRTISPSAEREQVDPESILWATFVFPI
jgi:hypothetical protein